MKKKWILIIVFLLVIPICFSQDRISPFVSFRFVRNSHNIETNRLNYLRDIYYYANILELTGRLATYERTDELIDKVQSFQNSDGGFGDWHRDRSKAGSTLLALKTLDVLGAGPLNTTGCIRFLDRLQVFNLSYGNYGFRSSNKESDADISSTYNVIAAYELLNAAIPNRDGVVTYVKDHQNTDGGFGYQTNRQSGVFWKSTSVHSRRGVMALSILGETLDFPSEATDFLLSLQNNDGGFSDVPRGTSTISYTYNTVLGLVDIHENIPKKTDIADFIKSNQLPSGGYVEYALDRHEGIHTTYYAIKILDYLSESYDKGIIIGFSNFFIDDRIDGGFGDYPGLGSNVRYTFDAVSILNLIGRNPKNRTATIGFIRSLENDDGGYGDGGISNVETTYRAMLALQYLGTSIKEPEKAVQFIRGCQNNDGGYGFSKGYVSRGAYTYRALRALEILGSTPLNEDGAVSYLDSLQNPDGGFGNYYGEGDSDIGSTYRTIRGLSILGTKPADINGVESFILNSQNPDGGFRRSPTDIYAPGNFSKSIFTYDAILGLHFLGRPIQDKEKVYLFIESLRNPDLGYSEQPFFTSGISSTFTALWAYFYLFPDNFNNPPNLTQAMVAPKIANSRQFFNFSVNYSDIEGQSPEHIHLVIGRRRIVMSPKNGVYFVSKQLSAGNHSFYFEASDGLNKTKTEQDWIMVYYATSPPRIELKIEPIEGTENTVFKYTLSYSDSEPAEYVKIAIDEDIWVDMTLVGTQFEFETQLNSGIHSVRAKASDGDNIVITEPVQLPIVHTFNASKPDWETYLIISRLLRRNLRMEISYDDVIRDSYNGKLVWKIGDIYVSYEGDKILTKSDGNERPEGPDGTGNNPAQKSSTLRTIGIVVIILLIIGIIIGFFIILKKNQGKNNSQIQVQNQNNNQNHYQYQNQNLNQNQGQNRD